MLSNTRSYRRDTSTADEYGGHDRDHETDREMNGEREHLIGTGNVHVAQASDHEERDAECPVRHERRCSQAGESFAYERDDGTDQQGHNDTNPDAKNPNARTLPVPRTEYLDGHGASQ